MRKTQLELNYLMNVIKYTSSTQDLSRFIQINKKCQETIKAFQQNFYLNKESLQKEMELFTGMKNYKGTNCIVEKFHQLFETFDYFDIEGSIEGIPIEKIRSWKTQNIGNDIPLMKSLQTIEINRDENYLEMQQMKQMKWSDLKDLKKVKITLMKDGSTPISEKEQKEEVKQMLKDIIKAIGTKSLIIFEIDNNEYLETLLETQQNVKVIHHTNDFDCIEECFKKYNTGEIRYMNKSNTITCEVKKYITNEVIKKLGLTKVKLVYDEENNVNDNKEKEIIDLSNEVTLKEIETGVMDKEFEWKMPSSLTRLSILYQPILNLNELIHMKDITVSQIPPIEMKELEKVTLYETKTLDGIEQFTLKELNLNYHRNDTMNLSNIFSRRR